MLHLEGFLSQTGPPWYIVTAIGAVAGYVLTEYHGAISYPIRRLRSNQFIGEWYEYHWTWHDNSRQLRHAKLKIKRGVMSPFTVRFDHTSHGSSKPATHNLRYKGDLQLEDGHAIVTLVGITHHERLTYRFPAWLPSAEQVTGLWMSFDHSGAPAAGGSLLSQQQLSDTDVTERMEHNLSTSPGFLRVSPRLKEFDTCKQSQLGTES
jgi:hypothetical protein